MFVYTLKASTVKTVALALFSIALIACLIIFLPTEDISSLPVTSTTQTNGDIRFFKLKDAEDMNEFIASLGWTVEKNPIEIVDVVIPNEFNNVYLKYNEIQKGQKLNLEKYKGKTAKRYTYVITNYPDTTQTVYLNLIIYKNKVIAGDVCSADVNGFIHGIKYSKDTNTANEAQ